MRALLAFVSMLIVAASQAGGGDQIVASRAEKPVVLFQPSSVAPPNLSASTAAKMEEDFFQREFLYSRWVRPTEDIDYTGAQKGDRVLFKVSEGESFELELTNVWATSDRSTIWYGRYPNVPGSTLYVVFSRPKGSTGKQQLRRASLQIPLQGRQVEVTTSAELPGWALLREPKLGTGTHRDNSDDTGGEAWREQAKRELERLKREQAETEGTSKSEI